MENSHTASRNYVSAAFMIGLTGEPVPEESKTHTYGVAEIRQMEATANMGWDCGNG